MMVRDHCILLVEDNADDALLIERALRKANFSTALHRVDDGQAACDYLEGAGVYSDRARHPVPTLVLLDIKLPKRSGLEVLKWLRSVPAWRNLIVVMLTSSREARDVAEAYQLGANSYLVKPIAPGELQELIKAMGTYWLRFNEPPFGASG